MDVLASPKSPQNITVAFDSNEETLQGNANQNRYVFTLHLQSLMRLLTTYNCSPSLFSFLKKKYIYFFFKLQD